MNNAQLIIQTWLVLKQCVDGMIPMVSGKLLTWKILASHVYEDNTYLNLSKLTYSSPVKLTSARACFIICGKDLRVISVRWKYTKFNWYLFIFHLIRLMTFTEANSGLQLVPESHLVFLLTADRDHLTTVFPTLGGLRRHQTEHFV